MIKREKVGRRDIWFVYEAKTLALGLVKYTTKFDRMMIASSRDAGGTCMEEDFVSKQSETYMYTNNNKGASQNIRHALVLARYCRGCIILCATYAGVRHSTEYSIKKKIKKKTSIFSFHTAVVGRLPAHSKGPRWSIRS